MLGAKRYCKFILLSVICLFISFSSNFASADDLLRRWPKTTQGNDPGQPDTIYLVCLTQTHIPPQQIIQVRFKTDNVNIDDLIAGVFIPLNIQTDKPGVVLDTHVSITYNGTALANWDVKAVSVLSNGGDPSQFPMDLLIGGADLGPPSQQSQLGAGDHLIATLFFKTSGPTLICLDTFTTAHAGGLLVVTNVATDYIPKWKSCCSDIPTLTQWGLIIFGLLFLGYVSYFIYRKRKPATVTRSFEGESRVGE